MNRRIATPTTPACFLTIGSITSLRFELNHKAMVITMKDRSKNRKPLQKGRNLSIEAIQAVQALKRANRNTYNSSLSELERVFDSKFRRLLKFDMMAVLRELLRQNECLLALKVFDDIRKEVWYKPQVLLYADMIAVFASNGLFKEAELVYSYLKTERSLDPDIMGFNALFNALISFKLTHLLMDCYGLMRAVGCEPDRSSFRILINGLESIGKTSFSAILRQDAQKCYGESLEFLEEEEEVTARY
ncbi:pentatricopeptide repeat-containing protein At3g46870 [Durio zibethinus]|uniref:Pentatricopeptide repeat-containing protein At3g46870 n=1 Tax=Durio zibethinus TaxID=66656 RepID=A0A6P6AG26_DURZI|nr:pentatricopeptide repeat-containing protein At3g46870 [Durio zibethinus]XP_022763823.1 pentatricopeptide repeat-containing protein At3g46870 [Durio zibethinus]XP_022763824.1 pentatricopeptide repeat-containing protein At3g46870 [Durio zibethinus]